MDVSHVPYRIAASYIWDVLNEHQIRLPAIGIICGSGLSKLSDILLEPRYIIPYGNIPGFPSHCTVEGHTGEIVFGILHHIPIMCFRGRFHSYEGYDMKTVVLPVNVMRCLNVQVCIVTNAAGGLNPTYQVGDVIAISDHLAIPQLAGKNPLIGSNDNELGPRFPATSNAYDDQLRTVAHHAAQKLQMNFFHSHGTYCFVSGPMYESKAECRLLHMLGGDCVGMSTVPEIVTAHHCGMKTLCLSLITNQVIMTGDEGSSIATHDEVLDAVAQRSQQMQLLVSQIIETMKEEYLPKLPPLRHVSLIIDDDIKFQYLSQQQPHYRHHNHGDNDATYKIQKYNTNQHNNNTSLHILSLLLSTGIALGTGIVIGIFYMRQLPSRPIRS